MTGSRLRCSACGMEPAEEPAPFRCPAARDGDDVDHVVVRELARPAFPDPADATLDANPFLVYGELLHSRWLGRAHGLSEVEANEMVRRLDEAVAGVDGRGFRVTPFARAGSLSGALGFGPDGGILVKDETGNVAGSHKARHLFGVLLYLEVRRRVGLGPSAGAPLAIASCGNAALAAAVLAKAARRPLEVFVPPAADPEMLERLRRLDAHVTVCPRGTGIPGDPSVQRFRAAVAAGAVPFTVQGPENGLTIEGGQTLGWEMVSALAREGRALDRLFVQVGGGALASACIAAFREAKRVGVVTRLPRVHAVQTEGGHPLERAHRRLLERPETEDRLRWAATHRSALMWPWETPPRSLAEAILDDETYDWRAVVEGMVDSGGGPVVVDEDMIRRANEAALRGTAPPASYTGTAGLAGLMKLVEAGEVEPSETVAVLFTGVRRGRGG